MQSEQHSFEQVRISRRLTLRRAIARGAGVIVVALAFTLLGETMIVAGSLTPLAVLLAVLVVALNYLGYVELALSTPRSGGAYALIREGARSRVLTFLAGWALVLSSVGLCGLLAQGAARHLGLLLQEALGLVIPAGLLATAFVVLLVLQSGLARRRDGRLSFAYPGMAAVMALAVLAAPRLPPAGYSGASSQPGPAIAVLIVAFVGIELITGRQQEIRQRSVNLPRAVFLTLALAAALGVGLAILVGPHAAAEIETPLAPLGEAIAGPVGRMGVLLMGGLLLLFSSRRVLMLTIRTLYVMSRDGFWPEWLQQVHPTRGTATRLSLLVGFLVLPAVWISPGLLGPTSGLLYLFVLLAVNLTLARRPQSMTPSTFAMPFHPWVPALVVVVDLLLVLLWDGVAFWAGGCLVLGVLFYVAYGRGRHIEAQAGVTVFRPPGDERAPDAFRVLVPVGDPGRTGNLLRMAGKLAQAGEGDVLALQIVVVPEPVPLEMGRWRARSGRDLLERALQPAAEEDLPVQTMTRVARSVAQGILETAVEEGADLIVMDWQAPIKVRGGSLGPVVDQVQRDAPCDVLIVRAEHFEVPRSILVPTSAGPHARASARLALLLAQAVQAEVTLMSVQLGALTPGQMEEGQLKIGETLRGLDLESPPRQKVVSASDPMEGIVREAEGYDLVLLGVSEESLLDQIVFGNIPLQVAARVAHTALVQGYRGVTGIWRRRFLTALQDAVPQLDAEERREVRRALMEDARPGGDYFVLIVLSCLIAALGLLLDSPAVVIGAMLVGPLMSPIIALSLGLAMGDLRLIRTSTEAVFKGVTLAVLMAVIIGILSPLKAITGEMTASAQPTLLDMAVALVSGIAGAYALARKDVSAALPGVAIAASLMPPLAALGLSLAMGDLRVASGAFLLFVTNIAAISLAGVGVFLLLGIRPQVEGPAFRRRLWRRLAGSFLLLLVISIPLGIIMVGTVRDAAHERAAWEVLARQLAVEEYELVALEVEAAPGRDGGIQVSATVQAARTIEPEMVRAFEEALSQRMAQPVQLDIIVLTVVRSE